MKDTLRLLRPFFRGLPLIILAVVVSVLAAKKYLSYTTPKYESTAKIKLADLTQGVPNNNLFKDFDVFASSNKIAAEIELIKSQALLSKVVTKLGSSLEVYRVGKVRKQELYLDIPFLVYCNSVESVKDIEFSLFIREDSTYTLSYQGEVMEGQLGDTLHFSGAQLLITANNKLLTKEELDLGGEYTFTFLSTEKQVEQLKHNLDVVPADKDVPVISIIVKSNIPQKSADIANQLAAVYIEDYIDSKYKAAETTVSFLDDRINEVSTDLSRSENRIEQYKDNKGIVNLRQESETDLRKIAQLKIQLSNLKISLDAIQELENNLRNNKDDFLRTAPNFQAYTDLLSTELIKKTKALQAEKRDLLLTYTANDEKVQVVDKKLDDIIIYLIEGVTNSKRNLKTKYNQLQAEIEIAQQAFEGFASKQKDLTIMNRDFNIYEKSYNFLTEKRIEAEIAQAAKISFHRIISKAIPSKKPVSPNTIVIILLAAMLSLMGSIGLIYVVHMLKGKVNDHVTIESNSNIPVSIKTPYLKSSTEEKVHFLREAIQLDLKGLLPEKGLVVISSSKDNEGRQYHVKHLYKALTTQGKKVCIIACNEDQYHAEMVNFNEERFQQMNKESLSQEIKQLSQDYDLIIVDNQNLEEERIGLLLMKLASSNLYVVDSRRTPASLIEKVDLLVAEFHLPNFHFALNKAGYNPSVLGEIKTAVQFAFTFLNEKLRKKAVA
jgi:uncharacterized protein involved in exopolysaccharide biosynthesis